VPVVAFPSEQTFSNTRNYGIKRNTPELNHCLQIFFEAVKIVLLKQMKKYSQINMSLGLKVIS
jgi:hypothetical protein